VFVQSNDSGLAQQAATLVLSGALLLTGLSVVVLEAKKGRGSKAKAF